MNPLYQNSIYHRPKGKSSLKTVIRKLQRGKCSAAELARIELILKTEAAPKELPK